MTLQPSDCCSVSGPDTIGGWNARWLSEVQEARIHRETYIAILEASLRKRGAKQELAQAVGIRAHHLSYLLDPLDVRTPYRRAKAIAFALGLEPDQAETAIHHMQMSKRSETRARMQLPGSRGSAITPSAVADLVAVHDAATFASTTPAARANYVLARDAAIMLLGQVGKYTNPQSVVDVALVLSDALNVFNRPDQAFYVARLAHQIANDAPDSVAPITRLHAARAHAVAMHNLGDDLGAHSLLMSTRTSIKKLAEDPAIWVPSVARDSLNALSGVRRPAIAEAAALLALGMDALEGSPHGDGRAQEVMLLESYVRVLVRHGGARALRVARSISLPSLAEMESIPALGPLHKVLVLKTEALRARVLGSTDEAEHWLGLASDLASAAGLLHQLVRIDKLRERR